jgi:hypothetical protein
MGLRKSHMSNIIGEVRIVILLCLLIMYPLIMKVNYTVIDFTKHAQIEWFIPLPLIYIAMLQSILMVGLFTLYNTMIKFLPYIVVFILVSGFIITQIPYTIQGDNVLHSTNAKLITTYMKVPPYSNTYVNSYPSFFMLSAILSEVTEIEVLYSNVSLVALLHIISALVLYVFFSKFLGENTLVPLICVFTFLGNFHLTYFLSIFTPRLFAFPLFYLFLYTMFLILFERNSKAMWIVNILLLSAIITGHPTTPFYITLSMAGFLVYVFITRFLVQNRYGKGVHKLTSELKLLILAFILMSVLWMAWLLYRANLNFEWAVKLIFGQVESPWHKMYGISSPFIQEQLDLSKDFITSLLRVYRLLITTFPYLVGGIAAAFYILRIVTVREIGRKDVVLQEALLSVVAVSMFMGSLLLYLITGRGHDYFLLFSYPMFSSLAFLKLSAISHLMRSRKIMYTSSFLVTIGLLMSIIVLPLSFLSIHSTRVYIGPSDYSGLMFLANFGPDKDIGTTGDIFYDYAYFNPTYFWPGKSGRSSLIYADPRDLIEQSKKIPYVFEGDIVVRSLRQVYGFYFSGLSPVFWSNVDAHLTISHSRIYDNGYMILWCK